MQIYETIFERVRVMESNRWRVVTVIRESGDVFWILHRRRDEHLPICAGIGEWIAVKYGDNIPIDKFNDAYEIMGSSVNTIVRPNVSATNMEKHRAAARAAIECARTIVRKGARPWPAAARQ